MRFSTDDSIAAHRQTVHHLSRFNIVYCPILYVNIYVCIVRRTCGYRILPGLCHSSNLRFYVMSNRNRVARLRDCVNPISIVCFYRLIVINHLSPFHYDLSCIMFSGSRVYCAVTGPGPGETFVLLLSSLSCQCLDEVFLRRYF